MLGEERARESRLVILPEDDESGVEGIETRRQGRLNESLIRGKGRIQLSPAVSPLGELQRMMPSNSSPVKAWDIVF